ncbi:MAG: hypothetical protein ACI3ZT_00870 [Candidatus Cryptobacteroides sp.]
MTATQKNAYKVRELNQLEKTAIIWAIVTGCKDWNKIYLISRGKDPGTDTTNKKTLREYASKYKHTAAVVDFYREQENIFTLKYDAARAAEAAAGEDEQETEEGNESGKAGKLQGKKKQIDFTDTANALKELNKLANDIQDPKARADAIQAIQKMIAATTNEDEKKPDIQRFYTSLRCKDCILYQNAARDEESTQD